MSLVPRKKISFDCDGVLSECPWLPIEERTNAHYAKMKPVSEDVVPALHFLSTMYDIYVISTRGHMNANLGLRAWLHWVLGLELDSIAGVITYPTHPADEGTEDTHPPMDKAGIIRNLGIILHIDDSPKVVEACTDRGIYFPSTLYKMEPNVLPTLPTWNAIVEFLTTPGMEVHGSNGTTVRSPAVEARKVERLPEELVN